MLAARERLGLNQGALAEKAKCNIGHILKLEALDYTSHNISEIAVNVAVVLGLAVDEVMPEESIGTAIQSKYSKTFEADVRQLQCSRLALPSPIDVANLSELKEKIEDALHTLTYREREILKCRYGIGDGYTYTLEEVGRIFKLTRARVAAVEAKALLKLQYPSSAKKLEPFL